MSGLLARGRALPQLLLHAPAAGMCADGGGVNGTPLVSSYMLRAPTAVCADMPAWWPDSPLISGVLRCLCAD